MSGDEYIFKHSHTVCVGSSGQVDFLTTERSAGQTELNAFNHTVFTRFGDLQITTLELVIDRCFGYFIPLNSHRLRSRNFVSLCGVHFGQGVFHIATDKDIGEGCDTFCVGYCELLNLFTTEGCACELKLYAFYEAVLRSLGDLEVATLKGVGEVNRSSLTTYNSNGLTGLRFVFVDRFLGNGVSAGT